MKHLFKKWFTEVTKEQRKTFSVYEEVEGKRVALTGLPEITTEFVPRAGECINLVKGEIVYFYQVIEVNYIFHYSSSEFQEGNIVVKFKSAYPF